MITPITVSRAAIGSSILHPVQRSANFQLAINNSDHLVLIEPKLPLLHQYIKAPVKAPSPQPTAVKTEPEQGVAAESMETDKEPNEERETTAETRAEAVGPDASENAASNAQNAASNALNDASSALNDASKIEISPSSLFSVTPIFQTENLESLGFQFFSRLLINDRENRFNFGRIQEPLIVAHKWSPVQVASRDCLLGLLLNTGEVMVLQRDTLDASSYAVKFRTFTSLLDQLSLSGDRLTSDGDIIVSGSHFSELRLTDFSFGEYGKTPALFLAHESGDVSVHSLERGLPQMHRFSAGGLVVLSAWCTGAFYYVLSDNSVHHYDLATAQARQIKAASRFMVSNLAPVKSGLVVADTAYLHVLGSAASCARLPYHSVLSGLPLVENAAGFYAYLPFENGRFGAAHYDARTCSLSVVAKCPLLDAFAKQTLNRFSGVLAKEQARAPFAEFAPYLDDSAQGSLTVHGTSFVAGSLAVVYSLTPKNVVSHVIKSRKEYMVGFVPVEGGFEGGAESISEIFSFFLHTKDQVAALEASLANNSMEAFALGLNLWKNSWFSDPGTMELGLQPAASLAESLAVNFRENPKVNNLQRLYVLNHSVLKTLYAVQNKGSVSGVAQHIAETQHQQHHICNLVRTHVAHILLTWAQTQQEAFFTSDLDRFILNTYRKLVAKQYAVPIKPETTMTLTGELCTETFEVSADQIMEDDFLDVARSASDHKWPRCSATLLPIMGLSNNIDELETHNYLERKHEPSESEQESDLADGSYVAQTLRHELDYCIYTGTRTFRLKRGV